MKLLMFIIGAAFMYAALLFVGKIRERIEESNFVRVDDNGEWILIDMRNVDFIEGDTEKCVFVYKDGHRWTTETDSYYKVMFRIAATTSWAPRN